MNIFLGEEVFEKTFYLDKNIADITALKKALESIERHGGRAKIKKFECARKKGTFSKAEISVHASSKEALDTIRQELMQYGAKTIDSGDATLTYVEQQRIAPDNFYHTTNLETEVKINSVWHKVQNQKMDALIAWDGKYAKCVKLGSLKEQMLVVTNEIGVRTKETVEEKKEKTFSFMSGDVSSESNSNFKVNYVAGLCSKMRAQGKKIAYVLGPAVVHSGADAYVSRLIKEGFVDVLLTGNALAVHDMEKCLYGTSLGVCKISGENTESGYKNHLKAINEVNKKGSIKKAVESRLITEGIMYECVKNNVDYVLAGSLRDDGPLFDVITDTKEAQNAYLDALDDVGLVVIGATMLHGIAVGNLLPADVFTVCVDIEAAVVTKLKDRGTWQAIGIVDNVAHFFEKLYQELSRSFNHKYALS